MTYGVSGGSPHLGSMFPKLPRPPFAFILESHEPPKIDKIEVQRLLAAKTNFLCTFVTHFLSTPEPLGPQKPTNSLRKQ